MSYHKRKYAVEALNELPDMVWCPRCNEWTELTIGDHSFGHAFGCEYIYEIETKCCGGHTWDERGPCLYAIVTTDGVMCDLPGEDLSPCESKDECPAWEEKV